MADDQLKLTVFGERATLCARSVAGGRRQARAVARVGRAEDCLQGGATGPGLIALRAARAAVCGRRSAPRRRARRIRGRLLYARAVGGARILKAGVLRNDQISHIAVGCESGALCPGLHAVGVARTCRGAPVRALGSLGANAHAELLQLRALSLAVAFGARAASRRGEEDDTPSTTAKNDAPTAVAKGGTLGADGMPAVAKTRSVAQRCFLFMQGIGRRTARNDASLHTLLSAVAPASPNDALLRERREPRRLRAVHGAHTDPEVRR